MTSGMKSIIYPVKDLAQAKKLYGKLLGVEPHADEAYYVGFRVGDLTAPAATGSRRIRPALGRPPRTQAQAGTRRRMPRCSLPGASLLRC